MHPPKFDDCCSCLTGKNTVLLEDSQGDLLVAQMRRKNNLKRIMHNEEIDVDEVENGSLTEVLPETNFERQAENVHNCHWYSNGSSISGYVEKWFLSVA